MSYIDVNERLLGRRKSSEDNGAYVVSSLIRDYGVGHVG